MRAVSLPSNNTKVILNLLEHKANANIQDDTGVYIFHFAPNPGGGGQKYELLAGWGKKYDDFQRKIK